MLNMKKYLFQIFALLAFLSQHNQAFAQLTTPYPDSSFNQTGKAALNRFLFFEPSATAVQPDGKTLTVGYGQATSNNFFDGIIFRLQADGTPDKSFGNDGALLLDVDGGHDNAQGVVVLPDNKILVLLESAFRTILLKLNPDGSPDLSFGNDGIIFVPPAGDREFCTEMLLQSDGKILIASNQTPVGKPVYGTVRRCNLDGSLDTSYGSNGSVKLAFDPSRNFSPNAIALQADGKLLITGSFGVKDNSGFPIIRLNTDGSFDNSFSQDGIYTKLMGSTANSAIAESMAVTPDGLILVGGTSPTFAGNVMTILGVTPTGATDGSFGAFGTAKIPFTIYASARKLIIQPDGKILAGGYTYLDPPTKTRLAFARLNPNGTQDVTFGNLSGSFVATLDTKYDLHAILDMALLPNGRLLGMAWLQPSLSSIPNNNSTCSMVRYITGITVKAEEPSNLFQEVAVWPNPIADEEVSIAYTLEKASEVSVHLYDVQGMEIEKLVSRSARAAGPQSDRFFLPGSTRTGTYFVVLSSENEDKVVKIIKK